MDHHNAPVREENETPLNYIVRVVNWLSEPDRRRLGLETRQQIIEAANELQRGQ